MDNLTLALKLTGKEKATEEKSELVNPSTASIVYMVAVTASSGGEVVLMDEVEEAAEWEDGDFTEVDEDGAFEEYISDDDPLEDVDNTVVDMTDGDGVDIEETGGEAIAYTVADYHNDAVAAYSEEEGEVVEDDLPDEDTDIDDIIDDGDAEVIPDVGELNEDDLPDEDATTGELSDDEYTLSDDNSDDVSDEIEGAEASDGYTVAECIGSVKAGDRVAVMVQNGKLTVIGVVGSGDEEEALRQQAAEAADEASEAAADAQEKAEQAQQQAAGAAQDATEAKQQADAANTAATNAQNAANSAATEAGEALQKANDAKAKADTVEENMTEVNKEVSAVKEDAVKLRADMESEIQTVKTTMSQTYATKNEVSASETTLRAEFTESVAGIQSTFAQDYAKKTELDDAIITAKADLQSQITQNANSIALTVKSVEDIQVDITSQDGKIAAAQQAATDAQTVANQAKTDATEAQTAASNAQAQAQAANTAASQAQTEANEAKSKADQAQSLADSAKTDLEEAQAKLAEVEDNVSASAEDIAQAQQAVADAQAAVITAQAAADKAKADAATAQTTADQAKTSASNASTAAETAQTKANEAKTAAENAQKSADEAKEDLAALEERVVTAETKIEQNSEAILLRATKTELSGVSSVANAAKNTADTVSTNLANNYYNKTQTDAQIKVSADNILSTVSETYQTLDDMGNYSTTTQMNSAINQKADSITSTVSSTYLSKTDAGSTYATKTALSTLTQTVNSIEGRVEDAEGNISTLTQTASGLSVSLEAVESTANTAKSTAETAKSTADTAKSTADTAKTTATNASTAAGEAKTTASNAASTASAASTAASEAKTTASNAASTASAAQTTANTAKSTADTAKSTADTAKTNAATAQSTADTAKTNAATAQSTANTARTEAANAAKTATNFMSYDSTNGLLIGNKSSGSWSGSRAQIKPSAFNILASNGTVLASYQAARIDLGINDKATVINLCGGNGSIKSTEAASSWKRLTIESGDSIDLKTGGSVNLSAGSTSNGTWAGLSVIASEQWRGSDAAGISLHLLNEDVNHSINLAEGSINLSVYNTGESLESTFTLEAYDGIRSCTINTTSVWISGDVTAYGDICLGTTNKSIIGTDTDGADRRLLTLNNNNNCVINYDSYVKAAGDTNVYGNNIALKAKEYVYSDTSIVFDNAQGVRTYLGNGTTNVGMMHLSSSNNLLIGNATYFDNLYLYTTGFTLRLSPPDAGSSVDGYFYPVADGTVTCGSSSHKWYRLYAASATVLTSDERMKENIVPLGASPMATYSLRGETASVDIHSELFDRLIPVQYNYIKGDGKTCFGLIAQQILSAMEELGINESELDLVHHDTWVDEETGEEKDTYGLAYENLIALLIHEVQKLKQQKS